MSASMNIVDVLGTWLSSFESMVLLARNLWLFLEPPFAFAVKGKAGSAAWLLAPAFFFAALSSALPSLSPSAAAPSAFSRSCSLAGSDNTLGESEDEGEAEGEGWGYILEVFLIGRVG